MPSWLCNSMALSTLYRCLLTTMAQYKPFHEILLIRDCCNHKGSCTLVSPYLTIAAPRVHCSSFYKTISSEFLVQGNFKHTQFSQEHWYWRDSNSQPLAWKANTVSTELTWLPSYTCTPWQSVYLCISMTNWYLLLICQWYLSTSMAEILFCKNLSFKSMGYTCLHNSTLMYCSNNKSCFLKEPALIFLILLKTFTIWVPDEITHFAHNPCAILELKCFVWETLLKMYLIRLPKNKCLVVLHSFL